MTAARKPTLLDKMAFVRAASRQCRMTRVERDVLEAIVMRILGLDGARPHNGWTTSGVLAAEANTTDRSVRRALSRLEGWGVLRRISVPGRGGRVCLHVPGIHGAAAAFKARPLGHRTADEAAPEGGHDSTTDRVSDTISPDSEPSSKTGQDGHVFAVENRTKRASKTGPRGQVNPSISPKTGFNPSERARRCAAEPTAGAGQGFENDRGKEGALTHARARLLARIQGLAGKAGHQVNGRFLEHVGDEVVQRWLRLQRDKRDAALVSDVLELMADYLATDKAALGAAVAADAPQKPARAHKPAEPIRGTPKTETRFTPPGEAPAAASPIRPPTSPALPCATPARRAPAPEPRPPVTHSPEQMAESARRCMASMDNPRAMHAVRAHASCYDLCDA